MKLVLVKFFDPTVRGQWSHMEEIKESKPRICYAHGLLAPSDDENIIKVHLLSGDDKESASNWIDIPKGCVISIDVISEVDWNG